MFSTQIDRSKCCLCYSNSNKYLQGNCPPNIPAPLVLCCRKYLSPEITGNIFRDGVSNHFCEKCHTDAEKLLLLKSQLDFIEKEIYEHTRLMTEYISSKRIDFGFTNNLPATFSTAHNENTFGNSQNRRPEVSQGFSDVSCDQDESNEDSFGTSTKSTRPIVGPSEQNFAEISCNGQGKFKVPNNSEFHYREKDGNIARQKAVISTGHSPADANIDDDDHLSTNIGSESPEETYENEAGNATHSALPNSENSLGFECDKCFKKFSTYFILQSHDCKKRTFECETCGKSYSSLSVLKLHTRVHTKELPFNCEICGKGFAIKTNWHRHIKMHAGVKEYRSYLRVKEAKEFECETCHKKFGKSSILQNHDCEKRTYECEVCGKSFATFFVLKLHKRSHTGERPFKCDICDKGFTIKANLQRHIRVHTGEKPFKCDICGKEFADETGCTRHRRRHQGTPKSMEQFKCEICSKVLKDYATLKNHLSTHLHKTEKCDICLRSFYNRERLEKHKKVHTDKTCVCELCGKSVSNWQVLRDHMLLHEGKKPYECQICKQSFRRKTELTKHLEVHADKEPYICELCGNTYKTSLRLKLHKKRTHSENNWECAECGVKLKTKQSLDNHKMTAHGSGRPFECLNCTATFKVKKGLQRHQRKMQGKCEKGKNIQCDICHKMFLHSSGLIKHQKKFHKQQFPPKSLRRGSPEKKPTRTTRQQSKSSNQIENTIPNDGLPNKVDYPTFSDDSESEDGNYVVKQEVEDSSEFDEDEDYHPPLTKTTKFNPADVTEIKTEVETKEL